MAKHDEYRMGPRRKEQGAGPRSAVSETAGPNRARPARYALYALVVVGILILYMLMNPIQQHVQVPTVDFNPAGKQAAWKLTDSWLTDGKPLGMNPSIGLLGWQ